MNDIETENSYDDEGSVIGMVIETENVLKHIVYITVIILLGILREFDSERARTFIHRTIQSNIFN